MRKFDVDAGGTLDWLEFLQLWRSGAEFFHFTVRCGRWDAGGGQEGDGLELEEACA